MSHTRRTGGFGPKEVLLALIVILVCAAILFPLAIRKQNDNLLLSDAGRMRNLYVALAFYEEQYDNAPAPNLVSASTYDPNRAHYLSDKDPFADPSKVISQVAKLIPCDPGLDNGEYSAFRISFSYLVNFARAGKLKLKPWEDTRRDPRIGELADEWLGSVSPGNPYQAQVSGRVLRVNTDGAVYMLKDRGGPKPLGDAEDLFLKRQR